MTDFEETISPNNVTKLKGSLFDISSGGNRKIRFKTLGADTCKNLCKSNGLPDSQTIIGICTRGVALCEVRFFLSTVLIFSFTLSQHNTH